MMFVPGHKIETLIGLLALLSAFQIAAAGNSDCPPATWQFPRTLDTTIRPEPTCRPKFKSASVAAVGNVQTGEINCRYWGSSSSQVNQQTCSELARKYGISDEKFFWLNPDLDRNCANVRAYTEYCVEGFIEPLRATKTNGRCGPPNGNATCKGYQLKQCCNSETWTCGNSEADCAKGTCYEGICYGDKVYSTDGTCGHQHGNRLCAGKWGDCCRVDGVCGTGIDFCEPDVCQSGSCRERPEHSAS